MRYIQLGNGGGLDVRKTNSSFLVEVGENEYLLVDCGFNVPEKLLDLEENDEHFRIDQIKHVFISHTHMDHLGGLETLIFINFFKNNVKMIVYTGNMETNDQIKQMLPDRAFKGGRESCMAFAEELISLQNSSYRKITEKTKIRILYQTWHPCSKNNGIIIEKEGKFLAITGDTKASELLEEEIIEKASEYKNENIVVFHDYSLWDCPSRNIHACRTDFEDEYSKEFKELVVKYHTGQKFNENWREF